ncbi:hypothetical protein MSG28_008322 [Choristoneura fumiferana]|uniref:Uncharacterized protein n=1 Tax=Choristoneura fumiferana TaxID=7141 RepID=A0ACC0JB07_CHOFU|nr:hypothetical protein MSG28_008322 [Choristoneura fumiferana]
MMGNDEKECEKKKLNDDLVAFMKRRSDTELPRYTTRLHNYVKLQQRRAAAAKRHSDHHHERNKSASRKQGDAKEGDTTDAGMLNVCSSEQQENPEGGRVMRRARRECGHRGAHSSSRSMSGDPQDRCGRRRRRRRRRRSCGRLSPPPTQPQPPPPPPQLPPTPQAPQDAPPPPPPLLARRRGVL